MECVEKIIKRDWINPLDSTTITEADIIPLQRVIILKTRKILLKRDTIILKIVHFLLGWHWILSCE